MPVSGEVAQVNADLQNKPEIVNNDPYGKGWMVKLKISNANETKGLLSAAQYKDVIGQ
jgi:glycine cleavage system H protein